MKTSMPKGPGLVTVNVPPCISSAVRAPARARSISSRERAATWRSVRSGNVADHRDQKAGVGIDGDANVDRLRQITIRSPSQRELRSG